MNVTVYLYNAYDKSAFKILKLLDDNDIRFSVHTFGEEESIEDISDFIGWKVRRLPQVIIDGDKVGGFYDLAEYLVNKNIITYRGAI